MPPPPPGVGHHRVEPAGRLARDVDRRLHAVLVGDVGDDVLHAAAVAHRFTDDLGGVDEPRLGAAADGHRGTVGREARRARLPDPGAAAGHERGVALEPATRLCHVIDLRVRCSRSKTAWQSR